MGRLRVALGDLRHRTTGRNFVFMPLGIGCLASYALSRLGGGRLEVRLFDDPDALLGALASWKPDVLGLSNYCWNAELSRLVFARAKSLSPRTLTVAGGPEFPLSDAQSRACLRTRPELDLFVRLEGEEAFAQVLERFIANRDAAALRADPPKGVLALHPGTGRLSFAGPMPRIADLDAIPSPYLTGLMDQWFNGLYAPSIETTRGCPFSCGFCYAGQAACRRVTRFSLKRVLAELDYIAARMRGHPGILLSICDSNFGMYEADERIAQRCRELQDRCGWPNAFDVTTGKRRYDRILRIAGILRNRMQVTCSAQSFNPKTLAAIERQNLPIGEFREVQAELKRRGMLSVAELIMPLPEETRASFLRGMKTLLDTGVEYVVPYTTMLLKGTRLASPEYRAKYGIVRRFRVLPRQFGEYLGTKCFEIEEVGVATRTMSFRDYLELRGLGLVCALFSSEQFDAVHRLLKESGAGAYGFYHGLWRAVASGGTALSPSYRRYLAECRGELWPSRKALAAFYGKPRNYEALLSGRLGDNLIRKYRTELLLEAGVPAIDLAFAGLARRRAGPPAAARDAVRRWMTLTRDLRPVFGTQTFGCVDRVEELPYDVEAWYRSPGRPLAGWEGRAVFRFRYDAKRIGPILEQGRRLYGEDPAFRAGKLFTNWSVRDFWCGCERVDSRPQK